MTTQEWAAVAARMSAWWPAAEFPNATLAVWYEDLAEYDAAAVLAALKVVRAKGSPFAPALGEVLTALHTDPSAPTFDEMFTLLFGPRGCLTARGFENTRARLRRVHPLVAAFCERQGIQRLKELPVHDPDDGHWRRRDLAEAWAAHVAAMEGREAAALARGGGADGLRRLDPLAALGVDGSARGLPAGEGSS